MGFCEKDKGCCRMVKSLANWVSITRILLALSLTLVKPLGLWFNLIYVACGISDVLDGYIARKTRTESRLGAKLDSLADLVMVAVLVMLLYPVIDLPAPIVLWILFIAIIRATSLVVVFLKFRTFEILHTYGNKITGMLLFTYPLSLSFSRADYLMELICAVASISAMEELVIHLWSKKLATGRKSIFIHSK